MNIIKTFFSSVTQHHLKLHDKRRSLSEIFHWAVKKLLQFYFGVKASGAKGLPTRGLV